MGHNGAVLSGNKKVQRITVLVIIGAVVLSLALSLLTGAGALGLTPGASSAASGLHPAVVGAADPVSSPSPTTGSADNPKPVTKTPQGQATQVTDTEHLGGLIAFLSFMLGGVLLLVRTHRRDQRERRSGSILM